MKRQIAARLWLRLPAGCSARALCASGVLLTGLSPLCAPAADVLHNPSDEAGWHWYHEPAPEEVEEEVTAPPPAVSPEARMAALQRETKAALAAAIMTPTVENFARFKRLQDFWTARAGEFSMVAQKAMLAHPELDYNLQHSHYNGTARLQQADDRRREREAIAALAGRYGVFLFYRGGEAADAQLAEVVNGFSREHGVAFIPVTVDGKASATLPETRMNQGQAERLGVVHFPALVLVDPREGTAKPLAYGFITQDDLARRFLYVATDFKPNF